MKTFLIVLVMLASADGTEDLYIVENPSFPNTNQCVAYVQENNNMLVGRATLEYNGRGVQDIYCVDQKKLATLLTGV
tara:strand:+ start:153 stop:383 length:231 start_codon:yes stop_codon:yes gene_type:complete